MYETAGIMHETAYMTNEVDKKLYEIHVNEWIFFLDLRLVEPEQAENERGIPRKMRR